MRVALLDDYLGVATQLAPFDRLSPQANVAVFRRHVDDRDELIELLKEVECVAVMRERTPLDRALIEALPNLPVVTERNHF